MGKSRGFSLAELVVAVGLFAVVALSLIGLITSSLSAKTKGEKQVLAGHLADEEMHLAKSRPYDTLLAQVGVPPVVTTQDVGGDSFQKSFSVISLPDPVLNPDGSVLQLTVQVDWLEKTTLGDQGTTTERPATLMLHSVVTSGASF